MNPLLIEELEAVAQALLRRGETVSSARQIRNAEVNNCGMQ